MGRPKKDTTATPKTAKDIVKDAEETEKAPTAPATKEAEKPKSRYTFTRIDH